MSEKIKLFDGSPPTFKEIVEQLKENEVREKERIARGEPPISIVDYITLLPRKYL